MVMQELSNTLQLMMIICAVLFAAGCLLHSEIRGWKLKLSILFFMLAMTVLEGPAAQFLELSISSRHTLLFRILSVPIALWTLWDFIQVRNYKTRWSTSLIIFTCLLTYFSIFILPFEKTLTNLFLANMFFSAYCIWAILFSIIIYFASHIYFSKQKQGKGHSIVFDITLILFMSFIITMLMINSGLLIIAIDQTLIVFVIMLQFLLSSRTLYLMFKNLQDTNEIEKRRESVGHFIKTTPLRSKRREWPQDPTISH
jgi:hypothetical protein